MSRLFSDDVVAKARETGLADDDIPDFSDDSGIVVLRQTELATYADCPMAARLIADGAIVDCTAATLIGQEIHDAYAEAIDEYIGMADPFIHPAALADVVRGRLLRSRPDVQSEAVDSAWHAAYRVGEHIANVGHPGNILRYDGGKGARSGQLSVKIPHLGCVVTSEVDLLYKGPAKLTLHETDWKSGRTYWSVGSVARSFQFQTHAYLVLENYPDVESLEITVATTRFGGWVYPVTFRREDLPQYAARVYKAAEAAMTYRSRPIDDVAVWPSAEKCSACNVAARCRITPPESCASNPEAFVLSMHTLQCALKAMKDEATEYVAAHGDITCNGLAFGIEKPKAARRPKSDLYIQGETDADD